MSRAAISLKQLEEDLLTCYFARRPFEARQLGVEIARGAMPLIDAERVEDIAAAFGRIRAHCERLLTTSLTADERFACGLMNEISSYELTALREMPHRFVVSPLPEAGLTSQLLVLLPHLSIGSAQAAEEYREMCAVIPTLLQQSTAALQAGRFHGQTPVRHLVLRVIGQIEQYLDLPLADDPYCSAVRTEGVADDLIFEIRSLAESRIRPAFRRYVEHLQQHVWPSARGADRAGLGWISDGEERYANALRRYTTLELTPVRTHDIGLALVEELRREMEHIGGAAGLAGGFTRLCRHLRDDPSLYDRNPAEMLARTRRALARAESIAADWITELPNDGCQVREMDDLESRNGVLGRYQPAALDGSRPAYYLLNTEHARRSPIYETAVLAHHESVPGHHLETVETRDAVAASPFRQLLRVLPFYEGWCLYMERFADELGLYEDVVSRLGMVSFALWRSCRLVVDTGIHQLGWSRAKGIDFMWNNTALTRRNIMNEVDRYIAHPGSAVGYMIDVLRYEKSARTWEWTAR